MQARQKGIAVILVTHNVTHAMTVGDHFAVLIRGALAADFRKGERTREEITDLMAGGEAMAELEAEIESLPAGAPRARPRPDELERDDPRQDNHLTRTTTAHGRH